MRPLSPATTMATVSRTSSSTAPAPVPTLSGTDLIKSTSSKMCFSSTWAATTSPSDRVSACDRPFSEPIQTRVPVNLLSGFLSRVKGGPVIAADVGDRDHRDQTAERLLLWGLHQRGLPIGDRARGLNGLADRPAAE